MPVYTCLASYKLEYIYAQTGETKYASNSKQLTISDSKRRHAVYARFMAADGCRNFQTRLSKCLWRNASLQLYNYSTYQKNARRPQQLKVTIRSTGASVNRSNRCPLVFFTTCAILAVRVLHDWLTTLLRFLSNRIYRA